MIKFIPTTRLYDDVGEQYFDLVKNLYQTADNHFESEWTTKISLGLSIENGVFSNQLLVDDSIS